MFFLATLVVLAPFGAWKLVEILVDASDWMRARRHAQRINMPRGRVIHLEGWRRR